MNNCDSAAWSYRCGLSITQHLFNKLWCEPLGEHLIYFKHVLYFHISHEKWTTFVFSHTIKSHMRHRPTTTQCAQSAARVRYGLIPLYMSHIENHSTECENIMYRGLGLLWWWTIWYIFVSVYYVASLHTIERSRHWIPWCTMMNHSKPHIVNHCELVNIALHWSLESAQSWQYRYRGKPEVSTMHYCYRMTLMVLYSAQYGDKPLHPRPLNSLGHCICTIALANIGPTRIQTHYTFRATTGSNEEPSGPALPWRRPTMVCQSY